MQIYQPPRKFSGSKKSSNLERQAHKNTLKKAVTNVEFDDTDKVTTDNVKSVFLKFTELNQKHFWNVLRAAFFKTFDKFLPTFDNTDTDTTVCRKTLDLHTVYLTPALALRGNMRYTT